MPPRLWTDPPPIGHLTKMDDHLSAVHSTLQLALTSSLDAAGWTQAFASIQEPLSRLHFIFNHFKDNASFPSVVDDILVAASLTAHEHGLTDLDPWQRSKKAAEDAALFSTFDLGQTPLSSYLNPFLPSTHQLTLRSALPSVPVPIQPPTPQPPIVVPVTQPTPTPATRKKPASSRAKSPAPARRLSPVAGPSRVKTKAPKTSSSKPVPASQSSAAMDTSQLSASEDIPTQVRQQVLGNIEVKRMASPVVEKASQPSHSEARKVKAPKGPTPLPAHGTRRRRPESPDPRPQAPVAAESDSDYVDEGSEQEASRPRKRRRRQSPSRAEKLMFTDDEECGIPPHRCYVLVPPQPPDIRRNKKEKNEEIEPVAEAAGLAIRGPGAAQCSLGRLAGSFRNQEI
ncbi:hypothetical protein V5O48_019013, partial [Marasmius crinis-equi]